MRFYGLTTELDRLHSADATVSATTLKATQYSGANEDCVLSNNDFGTGEWRLLNTAVNAPGAGVPWFVAEVAVTDHFSEFYLQGGNGPLPVELVSFRAERRGSAALLRWSTAQELNNERFEVQVSEDGRIFQTIGQVAGMGTSSRSHAYQWSDPYLQQYGSALVYYRLRQVDTDGTADLSPVRSVQVPDKAPQLTVWPNPLREKLQVTGLAPGQRVEILDALGRVMAGGIMPLAGPLSLPLPVPLPAGVYIVRGQGKTCKVVVQ
ncbi:T9SS type A sorting domain-containing protein [Hymenobacter cellulosilyticus]|uniref:T9SS type A sorting domain-containing protein n=1 Tax=Hymenobacter cellulosilyticus TaxID=2932248 RepID=A0A8T9QC40_9BACT|nr:T9SS type A sorting domain-containing protein [Hymenobacter cellulosilyticus]UOQ75106.1 T9SS type A sorting domain-containing protein [Hymenobacter cellulosilyticus]